MKRTYVFSVKKEEEIQERLTQIKNIPSINQCTGAVHYPITAQQLHDAVKNFQDKDPSDFTVEELIQVIKTIGNVSFIDMRNATSEGLETVDKFYYSWIGFVDTHPQLKELLDPHFIIFDFGSLGALTPCVGPPGWIGATGAVGTIGLGSAGIGPFDTLGLPVPVVPPPGLPPPVVPPPGLPPLVVPPPTGPPPPGAPPPGAPLPVISQYFYQVNGLPPQNLAARHFGGYMQGRFLGLHFFEFAFGGPILYW